MDEAFCLKNDQADTHGHIELTCAMRQCLAQDGNRFQVLDSGSCHIHDTFENRHFDSPKYRQNWNVLLPAIIRCTFLDCSEHRFHLHETIIHTKPYLLSYNVHVSKNHAC